MLVIAHTGLAVATGTQELVIDQEEADLLANATADVLAQFDLKPDPKTQAIIGLVVAAGTVYGPRVYMIRARKAAEAAEKKANANGVGTASVLNPDGSVGATNFQHMN